MKLAGLEKNSGFTLIEALVTVAVLTIIVVLATPSFIDAVDRRRVIAATEAISTQVQQARTTAIETGRPITMVFDSSAEPWCFGLTDAASCDCNIADSCQIPFSLDLNLNPGDYEEVAGSANQFTGAALSAAPARIRFHPDRGVRTNTIDPGDGSIEFLNPLESIVFISGRGKEARVQVNAIGRVSTCSPSGEKNVAGMNPCP